ncbi:MAG: cytochrome c assembly protein [Polaromonas sp.]|nr:cytochrome c assembly protein [Polaromonas sp.]
MNTTTSTRINTTTTLSAGQASTLSLNPGYLARRNALDWVFAVLVAGGFLYAFAQYSAYMDVYEKGILFATIPATIAIGWFWRPLRLLMGVVAVLSLLSIASYQGDLARAEQIFWLKYFLSSQSAILWMSMLFFMSTVFYWLGMFASTAPTGNGGSSHSATLESLGSKIAWVGVGMALIGTLVRWYESYLIGPDVGHIPVSNLYEVFVLFCWMTTAFYLYFEAEYKTRSLGAFVMLVVSGAVGFLLWYTVLR